ncbi:POTRA domain-containing protein [Aquimarina agarilytica]|uniref:POTRA domain-containing protein n=1 Tax=Aquimarina agarilytica TaxID=1087449 RepID=UPI001E5FD2C5|nr:POTRA domain-containing protein [Aquimarina agarilytica]
MDMKARVFLVVLLTSVVSSFAQGLKINELSFSGNKKTKASFLYRIAKVKVNSELDSLKIQTDIERIKRLDGIAHATYTVEQLNDGYKVNYDLKENFSIIPGLRIGEANNGDFSFRASLFEFNGLGRNIIFGGFYKREVFNSFGIFLEHPYLFTNKLGLGFNYQDDSTQQPIYFPDQQVNYIFTRKGPEVTLFYEHNFNNRFELGAKIFNESYKVIQGDPENEGVTDFVEPELDKAFIRGSYEYVDIDINYQNLSGVRNFTDVSYFIGGEGFLQTEYIINNTTQFYKRVGTQGNLATQLQLKFSNPVDDTPFVPLTIDNQLNTRGVGNTVDRGTSLIALNAEYRHTLLEKGWFVIQGNTFFDVSGVQRPNKDYGDIFEKETLRAYPGIGVRFIHKRIFNAVVRFDYSVNITGNGDNGLVFGIGQYF